MNESPIIDEPQSGERRHLRVSIVTISFNQCQFLDSAIRSVLQQRRNDLDLEYIVVDAGSTDGSLEVLDRYRNEVDHIVIEPDDGPADGLNKGVAMATGDVIGFINADDLLEPGALGFVVQFLAEHPEVDVVTGALRIVDRQGDHRWRNPWAPFFTIRRYVSWPIWLPGELTVQRFLDQTTNFLQPSTFITRRAWEVTDGFNIENRTSWDAELFIDMLLAGVRFERVDRVLSAFRLHEDSITGSKQLAEKEAAESVRIRQKCHSAGFRESNALKRTWLRLAWKLRPRYRLRSIKEYWRRS